METESTIWKISYINIQWWMIYNLWLSWNELLLYALIHWYTQDWKNEYHWSLTYIQNWLLLSRPTVISLLQKLQEKWLIVQTKESHYMASKESLLLVKKLYHPSKETLPVASKETLPNIYNTNNNTNHSLTSNEVNSFIENDITNKLLFNNNDDIVKLNIKTNASLNNDDIVVIDNKKEELVKNNNCKVKENKIKESQFDANEVFDKLWDFYPWKKNAKEAARTYFKKKIKTQYDLDLLRYALPLYISTVNDKNYLVLLRTYLSEERYKDYEQQFKNINKPLEKDTLQETNEWFKLKFNRTYEN